MVIRGDLVGVYNQIRHYFGVKYEAAGRSEASGLHIDDICRDVDYTIGGFYWLHKHEAEILKYKIMSALCGLRPACRLNQETILDLQRKCLGILEGVHLIERRR